MSDKNSAHITQDSSLAYVYGNNLYLNITNRCPTSCAFCIKRNWNWDYRGSNLKLGKEPTVPEIMETIRASASKKEFQEIVFCGYGESTYRMEEVKDVCAVLKRESPRLKRRLNTVGLGSLINERDIVPELAQCLDSISISLNTSDPDQWLKLHRPHPKFKENGFDAVLRFIKRSAELIADTTATAVELPGVDLRLCEILARSLGARYRLRPGL